MSPQKKVLVVDDEVSLVNLCRMILEAAGYEVRGALNGRQALSMVLEERPDIVLLDVMMPGMNGIEVCRQIRNRYHSTPPCIVMYTADERETTRQDSFQAGANALITKETPIFELPGKLTGHLCN